MSNSLPLPENLLTLHEAALNPANAALLQPINDMLTADAVLGVARLEAKELPVRSVSEWLRLGASPALEDVRQLYGWVATTPMGASGGSNEVLTERLYSLGESAANAMGQPMPGKYSTEAAVKNVLTDLQSSDANATASMILGHVGKFYSQATAALAGAGCPPFAAGCMAAGLMANRHTRPTSLLMVEPLAAMSFLPTPPLMGGKDGAWMSDWCNAIEKPDSAQAQEWLNELASKRSSAVLGTLGSLGVSTDTIAKQLCVRVDRNSQIVAQNGRIASQVAGRIYLDRQTVASGSNVVPNTAAKALDYLCETSTLIRGGATTRGFHGKAVAYYQPGALELLVDKPKMKLSEAISRAVRGPESLMREASSRAPLMPSDGPRTRKIV